MTVLQNWWKAHELDVWVAGFALGAVLAWYLILALVRIGRRQGAKTGTECGRVHDGACHMVNTWRGWRCRR